MIYYSHVNEDNRTEKKLLQSSGCTIAVVVSGSGERVLSLMDDNSCKKIYAVDVNEEALFLLQLKLAVLENFSIKEYFQFTGHYLAEKEKRNKWFDSIKNKLNPTCKMYWEKNISVIETGILYAGHFEIFLNRVRPVINFFLGKKFQLVLAGGSPYAKSFPVKRWKLISRIYSFRWIYKMWGNRDIAFISNDAAIGRIPEALNEVIYKNESASCFMMHLIFKGHLRDMKEEELPPSLQENVLVRIKEKLNTGAISIYYSHNDLLSFVKSEDSLPQQHVFYSVSDVLSFENPAYINELFPYTVKPGNTIVWRSFLRNRADEKQLKEFSEKYNGFSDSSEKESTKMYQVFAIQK